MAKIDEFFVELTSLINKYSLENDSNTADYILAKYMITCLEAFNQGVNRRDKQDSPKLEP